MDSSVKLRREIADSRAALYRLVSQAFHFPDASGFEAFRSGTWGRQVAEFFARLGYPFDEDSPLRLAANQDEYEVEFLRLYEVGMGGAPCPLSSGYYTRDRMRDLEEVVRFYRFFGYQPERTSDRFPDHLVFELEFMSHMAGQQAMGDADVESLQLGQRDFCDRHLASWIPQLRDAVERRADIRFFKDVMRATQDLVTADLVRLEKAAGQERKSA